MMNKQPYLKWVSILGFVTIAVILSINPEPTTASFWSGLVCGASLAAAPWITPKSAGPDVRDSE